MTGDHLLTSGGIHTHFTDEGRGDPVVMLHGFSGSTETMAGLAAAMTDRYRVLRIDLVGHGFSEKPDDAERYTIDTAVAQVVDVVAERCDQPAHLIGYSMGARVSLAAALAAPERFLTAVLIGGTAGIADPDARAERVRLDDHLATEIETNGTEWFADEWMAKPFFVTQRRLGQAHLQAARAQRVDNSARALANTLRGLGAGAQPSYWHLLRRLELPVLYIAGEDDAKFTSIGEQIVAAAPNAMLVLIPGVGHAAQVEAESEVADVIKYFFSKDHRGLFD